MSDPKPQPTSPRLLPLATFVLVILGTALAAVGLTLALVNSAYSDKASGAAAAESATTPTTTDEVPALSGDETTAPVGELAEADWVTVTAAATAIPPRALAAYAGASIALQESHPGCGLGWNTLAAIGQVASEHGATATPAAGDTGAGPMRILPAVWSAGAVDGDGDGTPDIESLDDAALTAGTHLCSGDADLIQPAALKTALASYDPDGKDVRKVVKVATTYATAAAG